MRLGNVCILPDFMYANKITNTVILLKNPSNFL